MTIPPNLFPTDLREQSNAIAAATKINEQKKILIDVETKLQEKIIEVNRLASRLGSIEPGPGAERVWSEQQDLAQQRSIVAQIFEQNCNEYLKRGGDLTTLHRIAGVRLKQNKNHTDSGI